MHFFHKLYSSQYYFPIIFLDFQVAIFSKTWNILGTLCILTQANGEQFYDS
jgi:hypothetical protein